jgi:bacteriocin-like protein
MLTGERRWVIKGVSNATQPMPEEQLKSSLDAEGAIPLEEGPAEELTDEELENVAGGRLEIRWGIGR